MSDLLVERHGPVTVFTLNRPEQRNALTLALREELALAVREFQADPDQRVAVVTGAGEVAFSAGADLKELAGSMPGAGRLPVVAEPDIAGLARCEKVTIAAINGLAVAGGLELSLGCDIRLAAEHAWFALTEVRLGMIAGVAATVLPRLMPIGAVSELMLTGDRLSATEAYRLGLVQHVTPGPDLLDTAIEKAETIARNSPAAVWGTKQVLRFWRDAMLGEQHRHYQDVAHRVLSTGDYLEGPAAFNEKRTPRFASGWPGTPHP